MIRVQDILDFLNAKAPLDTAEPWDNAGLLVGDAATAVQTVVTALDITPQVIRFAQQTLGMDTTKNNNKEDADNDY